MIVLLVLNTLTVFSQSVVDNEQLDWLFTRNNDAVRFEKELANCDSNTVNMNTKIDAMAQVAIKSDSITTQKDSIIKIQRIDIESKNKTIDNQGKTIIKKDRLIKFGGGGLIVLLIMYLLK